jgi:hypothetical protein
VAYDRKNDVVSIYFDSNEISDVNSNNSSTNGNDSGIQQRSYEVDEAANLILDMIDLVNDKGQFIGFRVFNASKHYDNELLDSADNEELTKNELSKRPNEKIIAKYSGIHNKICAQ